MTFLKNKIVILSFVALFASVTAIRAVAESKPSAASAVVKQPAKNNKGKKPVLDKAKFDSYRDQNAQRMFENQQTSRGAAGVEVEATKAANVK